MSNTMAPPTTSVPADCGRDLLVEEVLLPLVGLRDAERGGEWLPAEEILEKDDRRGFFFPPWEGIGGGV